MKNYPFLEFFQNHKFRYIDQTGEGRKPVSSDTIKPELNINGYESYFTVNGFNSGSATAKREDCTNLNAFFIDIDKKLTSEEIEKVKLFLLPTFIIETYHGFHFYWCLDEVIYKEDMSQEEWDRTLSRWERIEQSIVSTIPNADPVVKDLTRILRIPATYYWKKSGTSYIMGTDGVFKIKGVYKEPAHVYSMDKVEEAFPVKEQATNTKQVEQKTYAQGELKDFFDRVNEKFPIENRDSFKRLINGQDDSTLPFENCANQALVVTASLMKQAGWSLQKATDHVQKTGWHGIEKERGGSQEISNTIASAFRGGYSYSHKNPIVKHNISPEEEKMMFEVFSSVMKDKKELDKVRFYNYEQEIFTKYPHLKKTADRTIYNYSNGVYKKLTDMEVEKIFFNSLDDDMLWNYKTAKNISDKIKTLLAILPDLVLSDEKGNIFNLKNGLLDIYTLEMKPHTPDFVSLIQSPVEYKPDAKCPVWESCISAWMEGKESEKKTELLQQFAGYTLSSSMQYDRALFLVGDGGNGKSTFVDTIAMIIGKEATSHIDLEDLYSYFGMAGLVGKRLNVVEEVHGNYYQSNKLKKLVSGERITLNQKYKAQMDFTPECKFIFAVNIMPRVDDTSTAMERRICAIVFKNNFRAMPNTALRSSGGILASELSGILNWMLVGAKNLKEKGKFTSTMEQMELLREYRQENSSVEGFISEVLEFEEGIVTSARELYDNYKEYCIKDGRKFKGNIGFSKEMRAFGTRYMKFSFHERVSGHDVASFEGVKIADGWGKYSNNSVNVINYLNNK